ncbi:carboxypeptidase-like regulatory domain-containing protein [Myroides pelagicus]|uniref:TonB-dependent receptor n=1 Tax=Myroides pelagicus TaxID=270914 RepID=A0A7K1GNQ5_9FLAO|nr:carboxypeptidase-like regulatory domain-containing protein [Myroides pelagicus]MEC4113117.1 carboxypeptidase-like regulatory domain-containing protein [Myroides pelagicus]MTH29834.1 hypothetical protein [Myroides pelagicus]
MRKLLLFLLLFFQTFCFGQTLVGIVKSTNNLPLENANIIAKPIEENKKIKFAISDYKGRYKLELDKETNYTIRVSYIGYKADSLEYKYDKSIANYNFILIDKEEFLDEIIIEHNYQPIIIKKDTLIYDVKVFTNGNERKLRDQLEKLPGIEVSDTGQIKVQGKVVTHFMVENNPFFGGGSRLGVENIPADAVDKVEVIDHFTEIGHMKSVSGSDELAMNIKLKEDKKEFIFGDVRTGYGNNEFYESNTSLFYYAPTINWSVIANLNNIGSQLLTYDEAFRLEGIQSLYIKKNATNRLVNMYEYIKPNTDVLENKNQFISSDFRYSFNKNWNIKALVFFNKNWIRSKTEQNIQYLDVENTNIEDRLSLSNSRNELLSTKITTNYIHNKFTTFNYDLQLLATKKNQDSYIDFNKNSTQEKNLNSSNNIENFSFYQLFESHKTFNKKHKATLAFSHLYKKEDPQNKWFSDSRFLESYVPWSPSSTYALSQVKQTTQNNLQLNLKHYWIVDKKNHIYTTLGYVKTITNLGSENEYKDSGNWNSLGQANLGNYINYNLNNSFLGIEHKFLYKKFTSTLGLFLNYYNLENEYLLNTQVFQKKTIEPEIKLEYELNKSRNLRLNYIIQNTYLPADNYLTQWQISSFNSIFKGNALLNNVSYHRVNFRYSDFNVYSGFSGYFLVNYYRKNRSVKNQVELIGTDQFYQAFMSNQPDTNLNFSLLVNKKFKNWEITLNSNFGFNRFTQVINQKEISSKNDYQTLKGTMKTLFKNYPNLDITYIKSYRLLNSGISNKTTSDQLIVKTESKFLKYFLVKADYYWTKTTIQNNNVIVQQANLYLEYGKKTKPWTFILKGSNLFNTGIKNEVRYNDFIVSNTNDYILPRAVLFSIQYKI